MMSSEQNEDAFFQAEASLKSRLEEFKAKCAKTEFDAQERLLDVLADAGFNLAPSE